MSTDKTTRPNGFYALRVFIGVLFLMCMFVSYVLMHAGYGAMAIAIGTGTGYFAGGVRWLG